MTVRRVGAGLVAAVGSMTIGLTGIPGAAAAAPIAAAAPVAAAPAAAAAPATSVTPGTVTPNPATAGSNSSYTIGLTTAAALATGGTITLTAPAGTNFTGCTSCSGLYTIAVSGGSGDSATVASATSTATSTAAGTSPTANQVVLTLGQAQVAAGDTLTITTTETSNPVQAGTAYRISESTSADTTPAASPAYTITPAPAAKIAVQAGDEQSAQVGTPYGTDLAAVVTDSYGNPVPGRTVTFDVPSVAPSGTFAACPGNTGSTPANECVATTDASGVATASKLTADSTAGTFHATAAASTLNGTSTVSYTLTNTAVPPTSVVPGRVTLSTSTAGATAKYTVGLTTTTALTTGNTITLTFPNDTALPAGGCSALASCTAYTVAYGSPATNAYVSAATLSTAQGPGATSTSVTTNQVVIGLGATLNPVSIPAGTAVTITITGVVNPYLARADYVAQESDTPDTGVVATPAYAVTPGPATTLAVVAGDGQTATVGNQYPAPLQVQATDASGNPVPGATVAFTINRSGAIGGQFGNGTNTEQDTTGADGTVTTSPVRAGTGAGAYTVTAALSQGQAAQTFNLTETAGPLTQVAVVTGSPQSATVGSSFGAPLVASPEDRYGNPLSGVAVTFTAPATGATGTFTNGRATETDTSDSSGNATSTTLTAGHVAGPFTVVASATDASGKAATPADFALTDTAGAPAALSPVSAPESTTVGTAFPHPLTVQVSDAFGNPVGSGVAVDFATPAPGSPGAPATAPSATFAPGGTQADSATTGPNGQATSSALTADQVVGTYDATASLPSASGTAPVSLPLSNTAAPAAVAVVSGSAQTATVGAAFAAPLKAEVTDAGGHPIANAYVTFTAPATGATGSFAGGSGTDTVVTDSAGDATSTAFTAGTVAGGYSVVAAVGGKSAGFALTNKAGAVTSVSASSGSGQSAGAGTAYAHPLVALVTDRYGNPVADAPVTFTAPATGASVTFASGRATETDTSGADGRATSSTPTADSTTGSFTVTAATSGLDASFNLDNTVGVPSAVQAVSGSNQSARVGTAFANRFVALVTDRYGHPVPGIAVGFMAPGNGPSGTFSKTGTNSDSEVTDSAGQATSSVFTAGPTAGSYQVAASISAGAGAVYDVANLAGPAATLRVVSGTGQQAHVGQPFGAPLVVQVLDAQGNPVSGTPVTFTLPASAGGASIAGSAPARTVTTAADGEATSGRVVAGLTPGPLTVEASTVGAPSAAFGLTGTDGYWLAGSNGSVQAFGDATFRGSADGAPLTKPVVGMAATRDGRGYWLVASDGGIFNYGDAAFHGSTGGVRLNQPIVAMAADPATGGYWLVASDGGVFAFDAPFFGSTGGVHLDKPIVGMAAAPGGNGYWLVASDGGIFAFGPGSRFYGSTGGVQLNRPVVGMAAAPGGNGYWLVASDGGIFAFGPGSRFFGSTGNITLARPIVGMTAAPSGQGYWFVAADGGIFAFGPDARFYGSGANAGEPVIAMAEG